jgi:hypothetical protein
MSWLIGKNIDVYYWFVVFYTVIDVTVSLHYQYWLKNIV